MTDRDMGGSQTVVVRMNTGNGNVIDLVKFFTDRGFSVDAQHTGWDWTIRAERPSADAMIAARARRLEDGDERS